MRIGALAALACSLVACTTEPSGPGAGSDPDSPPDKQDDPEMPPPGAPSADELRAAVATCNTTVAGPFALDANGTPTVSICGRSGVLHWTADMDIDCDGKRTAECNLSTDPYFMEQTAAVDSMGDYLDSAALPFVVVPLKSTKFDYRAAGLAMGSPFAVIYRDKVVYGVLGDLGPAAIIGEASYRMAELLGIDPDPSTGGTASGVTYIGFTGADVIVDPLEDHELATMVGSDLARSLVDGTL